MNKKFPTSMEQETRLDLTKASQYADTLYFYNHLSGPLDIEVLRQSIGEIIARHQILGMRFDPNDHTVCELGLPLNPWFFEQDLRKISAEDTETALTESLENLLAAPMDITRPPLLRCYIYRLDENEYFLCMAFHHAVCDANSFTIFRGELEKIYAAKLEGQTPVLPQLPMQYGEFSIKQRESFNTDPHKAKIQYWKKKLAGLPKLKWHLDAQPTIEEGEIVEVVPKDKLDGLIAFGKKNGGTLYQVMLLVVSMVTSRLCRSDDVFFYSGLSPRPPQVKNLIGFFFSLNPVRIRVSREGRLVDRFNAVIEESLEGMLNQVPYGTLEKIDLGTADLDAFRAVPLVLNFTVDARVPLNLKNVESEYVEASAGEWPDPSIFVLASSASDKLTLSFGFNSNVFKRENVIGLTQEFLKIIDEICREQ